MAERRSSQRHGREHPVASRLNTLPKFVVSNTLEKVEWNNSTLIRGDVAQDITELKQRPGRELQVHGSGNLAQTLMAHDLIDEYRLWIYPVVLGNGPRLFREGATPAALKLVDTKTTAPASSSRSTSRRESRHTVPSRLNSSLQPRRIHQDRTERPRLTELSDLMEGRRLRDDCPAYEEARPTGEVIAQPSRCFISGTSARDRC
jgi:dihydrofolate reductase